LGELIRAAQKSPAAMEALLAGTKGLAMNMVRNMPREKINDFLQNFAEIVSKRIGHMDPEFAGSALKDAARRAKQVTTTQTGNIVTEGRDLRISMARADAAADKFYAQWGRRPSSDVDIQRALRTADLNPEQYQQARDYLTHGREGVTSQLSPAQARRAKGGVSPDVELQAKDAATEVLGEMRAGATWTKERVTAVEKALDPTNPDRKTWREIAADKTLNPKGTSWSGLFKQYHKAKEDPALPTTPISGASDDVDMPARRALSQSLKDEARKPVLDPVQPLWESLDAPAPAAPISGGSGFRSLPGAGDYDATADVKQYSKFVTHGDPRAVEPDRNIVRQLQAKQTQFQYGMPADEQFAIGSHPDMGRWDRAAIDSNQALRDAGYVWDVESTPDVLASWGLRQPVNRAGMKTTRPIMDIKSTEWGF